MDIFGVPWQRRAINLVLRRATRRLLRPVRRGIWLGAALVGLSDGVIFGCTVLGLAISTSAVVASSIVDVGLDWRPRQVRWAAYGNTISAWIVTVPACLAAGSSANSSWSSTKSATSPSTPKPPT